MKKHSFTFWTWEQDPKEVFFETREGAYSGYYPNYHMFKNKTFKYRKFGIFEMKKYKITIEECKDNKR